MGSTMRIGQGFDAHRFQAGDAVVLGGVTIPFDKGLAAHSDGDVLLHAICDALLGAAALGDIGRHFPDSSAEFKDVDSRALLREVGVMLAAEDTVVVNIDATIVAERPRVSTYVETMRDNIAADLDISREQVNVKGTTTEQMGFTGREEGIAATAMVLLSAA
ncbi:MAG: 2-C-methyl-D-erythritol 2,4-cyclodiphosphate synthase [Gammaproteobacteria bacterium]|nr:2-C-methyl-D-erythritol 2,4-cyclodiphosphate synthase [Gammaproteobacteria bacterium]HJP35187.1 2-C-methyl-D-erythritol 2,4-cyclodiphosphate synthase [Gammaproteobacteria bacterium]